MPSSPCPFKPRNGRAIDDLPRHPQHPLPSINRALPRPNSSHHQLLLPSLLLLDQTIHQIVAGAAAIWSLKPPEPADHRHGAIHPDGVLPARQWWRPSVRAGPDGAIHVPRAPFPEFFGGQVTDQPGGQMQWVIIADLRGTPEPPMTSRIQFSFRENSWMDGLARAMKEALARLTLRRENAKKDYKISRLRDQIANLKETIKTQEDQLKALESEGEGEDIQGDGYSYVSNDNDYEEDDDDLAFYPDEDGHEHLTAGMDDTVPIRVDEA
ncbi:hypothetical protein QYE76_042466 [Lolium multiflorum]|uniref:Uncharacterized protein n=1 Tax=Lolium multiflorum TaxID=4521 RepID=A0AAD8WXB8_LOLMU|nr:hypothetical protein QYE76_042466 [Lolium multiflorum]